MATRGERVPVEQQFLIPDPKRAGQTWARFLSILRGRGYVVEHRVLVAADYGAPTTRERLFLFARRDGEPIVWPEPTHFKQPARDRKSVVSGKCVSVRVALCGPLIIKKKIKSI